MQADRGQPHKERKADHIRINLEEDVTFPNLTTGLESYRLRHQALPELDLGAVELQHSLLGKRLSAPLLISSMTGGTARAQEINQRLAEAAQAAAWPWVSVRSARRWRRLRQPSRSRCATWRPTSFSWPTWARCS